MVFANDSDKGTVESFISMHKGAVINHLESYKSRAWSEEKVKQFIELTNKEWALIKSEKTPVKGGEAPFWCGLKSLSHAIDRVGSDEVIKSFISDSLLALKSNRAMQGEWLCERWEVSPKFVSLVNLIAHPMEYHNKLISVVGVGKLEFENDAIYLSKEHYRYGISKNGIWMHLTPKLIKNEIEELAKENGKYVHVEGRFDGLCEGHKSLWSGCFEYVTRYDIIEPKNN